MVTPRVTSEPAGIMRPLLPCTDWASVVVTRSPALTVLVQTRADGCTVSVTPSATVPMRGAAGAGAGAGAADGGCVMGLTTTGSGGGVVVCFFGVALAGVFATAAGRVAAGTGASLSGADVAVVGASCISRAGGVVAGAASLLPAHAAVSTRAERTSTEAATREL